MEERQTSGDGDKGKGKAPQRPQSHAEDSETPPNSSLASRIANSAVGLAGSMVGGPPSNAALAESLSGEKGQSSTANGSAQRVGESSVQLQQGAPSGSSFRGNQSQAHIAAEESAFATFLDGTSVLQPPESTSTLETAWQAHAAVLQGDGPNRRAKVYSSVDEQQRRDGEAVVSLLAGGDDVIFPDEAGDETMSPEDRDSLRRALFGGASGTAVSSHQWDNVLNFIPDYLRAGTGHIRASDRDAEWNNWVEGWSDVLTKYNDEVWGDLGSLVEQAQSELEQLEAAKPDDPPPETKALRRLQAILGHLRGRQGI